MDYYLRDLKESDLDDIHAYTSLPEVAKYQTWDPLTYEETEEFVQTLLNRDEDWMYNVIVDADTDNVIGAIQLISDKKNNSGEIEFTIHPEYWSNGIATDVARTIVKYGFKVLKLNRIWASTDINNTVSEIVLQKLKMRHEAILRQNIKLKDGYRDTLVYSILKDEY
ncbi:GNAT family N-acetyltransferase [Mammaliicoccus lentus]|uniref:GNAT family N-acetyltransferase n=1 Tax=Mammaliicoccus lentus TaxID=42858 RepID=UPI0002D297C5|nr:GNAT family protein [Mammaliicoccus lentus]MEB5686636.1 GNAT family N-acetyltransferase [Mammaliicoccus lentus]